MRIVFIAGPYRSATEWGVEQNICRAEALALRVWQAGAAALCPHKNTAHFGGACPDSVWLAGDLAMLKMCDAVIMVQAWEASAGAREERRVAIEFGLPVFYEEWFEDFKKWLQ